MTDILIKESSSTHKALKEAFSAKMAKESKNTQEWKSLSTNCINGPRARPGEKESKGYQIPRDKAQEPQSDQVADHSAVSETEAEKSAPHTQHGPSFSKVNNSNVAYCPWTCPSINIIILKGMCVVSVLPVKTVSACGLVHPDMLRA